MLIMKIKKFLVLSKLKKIVARQKANRILKGSRDGVM